ncbi:unnamed protein product [Paramecium sonneborni]|uniref:Uncharacterized protein n=1 Tax=Paramecium sonneborni TaxID=65129 RepID=A0A8S1NT69_9CILI|nr:unnamed protein product [Paramecium sonneborni]
MQDLKHIKLYNCIQYRSSENGGPRLKEKIKAENKYKNLYFYYFGVISLGKNSINLQRQLVIDFLKQLTLWDSLLKDQFQEVFDLKSQQNFKVLKKLDLTYVVKYGNFLKQQEKIIENLMKMMLGHFYL